MAVYNSALAFLSWVAQCLLPEQPKDQLRGSPRPPILPRELRIQQCPGWTHHCLQRPVSTGGPSGSSSTAGRSQDHLALGPLPFLFPGSDL